VLKDKRFWLGLGISVACVAMLVFAMAKMDWIKVWEALQKADWRWLALALLVYLAGYWWRCGRVAQILRPIKHVPSSRIMPPLMVGFMFNNILPGRLGEVVLAWLLGRREGIPKSAAFGTVVLSRVLDGFTILSFFLFGMLAFLPLAGSQDPTQRMDLGMFSLTRQELVGKVYLAGLLGLLVFGTVFLGCFCLIVWKERTLRLVERLLFWVPGSITKKGLDALQRFIGGLDILRQPGKLLLIFLFNFVPWGFEAATYYLTGKTLGIDMTVRQVALVMGMANLALLVPALPGGIGLFEGAGLMVLVSASIAPAPLALTFMILVHAMILIPINVLGFFFLWREGLSIKSVLEKSKGA
jgi:uncharacterized membrane protein YbhN (UPF0104 family)